MRQQTTVICILVRQNKRGRVGIRQHGYIYNYCPLGLTGAACGDGISNGVKEIEGERDDGQVLDGTGSLPVRRLDLVVARGANVYGRGRVYDARL